MTQWSDRLRAHARTATMVAGHAHGRIAQSGCSFWLSETVVVGSPGVSPKRSSVASIVKSSCFDTLVGGHMSRPTHRGNCIMRRPELCRISQCRTSGACLDYLALRTTGVSNDPLPYLGRYLVGGNPAFGCVYLRPLHQQLYRWLVHPGRPRSAKPLLHGELHTPPDPAMAIISRVVPLC